VPFVAEQMILPHLWRRYLSLLRLLVGAACLWMTLSSDPLPGPNIVGLIVAVSIYSLVAIFWRAPERIDRFGLLNLVVDVLFFLISVGLARENGFWVSAFAAFYLLLAAATLHQWREVLLLTVLSLGYVNFVQPPFTQQLQPVILLLGMFGCVLAVQKSALLERLSNSSRQAVLYRSEAQRAREAERERIAADFHDGPLQSFISFQMRLAILRKMLERDKDAAMQELTQLQELGSKQTTEIRTFVRSMRPVDVEGAGLASVLRSLSGAFQKDSGIVTAFQAEADASHDDIEATTDLLQIVREALNNVQKHSSASRVAIHLGRRNGTIELDIEDDGTGFPFAGSFTLEELELLHMGPMSIQRRVRSLNGEMTVDSRPGRGAGLRIRVPL
jgi:signal transduction histidine kinase